MNNALPYLIPFIEAIQKQSHTVEITLDRPHCSQTTGTFDTFLSDGSCGVLRGSAGTLWYTDVPKAYLESITIWLSPEELYIELAPHESPLPVERFPIQDCVPLPFRLAIRGSSFTATLSLCSHREPSNSASPGSRVTASR